MLLNLNASPAFVLEGKAIRPLISEVRQRVVLEITEHTAITDYEVFQRAALALGPAVRLAVDDAGAGFPAFRHISTPPAFVKLEPLDLRGIDRTGETGPRGRHAAVRPPTDPSSSPRLGDRYRRPP